MILKPTQNWKLVILIFCLSFFVFPNFSLGQIQRTDADLKFENIAIDANTVNGTIDIKNGTEGTLNNIALSLVLEDESRYVREKKDGPMILKPGQAIKNLPVADSNGEKFFNLPSGRSIKRNFIINYSKLIPAGNYILRASIYDIGGKSLAVASRYIKIAGKGGFLKIDPDDCKIFAGKDAFSPEDGATFFKGEKPKISCKIVNPGKSQVSVSPVFETNEFSLFRNPAAPEEKISEPITLKPYETKTAEFVLISGAEKPQVYETGVFFKTPDGSQISPYVLFRWIIKGAAARISHVEFDKDGYFKNDIAKISFRILQSPDLFWDYFPEHAPKGPDISRYSGTPLAHLAVAFQIKDGEGSLCGSLIESYGNEEGVLDKILEVPIGKNCANPASEIKIFNGEDLLNSAVFKSESLPATISAMRKEAAKFWLIIVAVCVFIIGLILVLRQKIRGGKIKNASSK